MGVAFILTSRSFFVVLTSLASFTSILIPLFNTDCYASKGLGQIVLANRPRSPPAGLCDEVMTGLFRIAYYGGYQQHRAG